MALLKIIRCCLLCFLLLTTAKSLWAQSPEKVCYDILTGKGDSCLALTNIEVDYYRRAIEFYTAAKDCGARGTERALDQKIQDALKQWVAELESARKRADRKAVEAEDQKDTALVQKERADSLAKEARRNACTSEANRLALFADIERQDGWDSAALYLAYRALQLDASPQIRRTFRKAVFNFYNKPISEEKENCTGFQYLPSTGQLLLVYADALVVLDSCDPVSVANWTISLDRPVDGALLSRSGEQLLAFREDSAMIWKRGAEETISLLGHAKRILSGAFSPSGDSILTCSRDHDARLWTTSGKLLTTLSAHEGNIYEGRFSPTGSRVLTRSSDETVGLWAPGGEFLKGISSHEPFMYQARFSPNGSTILTAGADSTARMWDLEGNTLASVKDTGGAITTAVFHPSGDTILTGTVSGSLKLWDKKKERSIRNFAGHKDKITGAAFSRDGRLLLSTSRDGTSRLWTTGGDLLMTLNLHNVNAPHSVFSQDGRSIIAARGTEGVLCCPLPGVLLSEWETRNLFSPEQIEAYEQKYQVKNDLTCDINPITPDQK